MHIHAAGKKHPKFRLLLFPVFSLCLVASAMPAAAIDHRDGGGELEECPKPIFCNQTMALTTINKQENGLHNSLNALHGPAQKVHNLYVKKTADPAVPDSEDEFNAYPPKGYEGNGISGSAR